MEKKSPPLFEQEENLHRYIDALSSASTRSRTLFIGLIFSSILAAIALINSVQGSWFKSRILTRQDAEEMLIFNNNEANDPQWATGVTDLDTFIQRASYPRTLTPKQIDTIYMGALEVPSEKLAELRQKNSFKTADWFRIKPPNAGIQNLEENVVKIYKSIEVVKANHLHSLQELHTSIEHLQEIRFEKLILISVPILGVAFDINFLGVISGTMFLALLLLCYYSLVREHRNLKILFSMSNDDATRHILYDILSMQQVLTVPLKLFSSDKWTDILTRKFAYVIFWLPTAVLGTIFTNDLLTMSYGNSLNASWAEYSTWITGFLLFLNGYWSYKITQEMNVSTGFGTTNHTTLIYRIYCKTQQTEKHFVIFGSKWSGNCKTTPSEKCTKGDA
jgi:hypothetical protein